jgi:GMP synthase-like glutamine amidotransferase
VNVLAVVNGEDAPAGTFGDVVFERGHRLDLWLPAERPEAPAPGAYDAVMVFGGAMHVDQDAEHPWLRGEVRYLRELLERRVPVLGVCLGAQLLAQSAGGRVGPAAKPEVGWLDVERTGEDPVLDVLPARFPAFQWHSYAFEVPPGAVELARSRVCAQAFRLGGTAWGVQFHPEVTSEIVGAWVDQAPEEAPDGLLAETDVRIDQWTRLGRALCAAFLEIPARS